MRQVHAILVQLPLPKHIDEALILRTIRVDKDPMWGGFRQRLLVQERGNEMAGSHACQNY